MTSDEPIAGCADLQGGFGPSETSAQKRLALMEQLQASLGRSHRALVALDLGGIEQGTREQLALGRTLAVEFELAKTELAKSQPAKTATAWWAAGGPDLLGSDLPRDLFRELRRCEWQVLQAARLQAALLRRAQRKLVIMANMLAGAERNYASGLASDPPPDPQRNRGWIAG
jgi:hypothetical protein